MPAPKAQEGEDPDPTPYLFVSLEQKRIDQTKPYDAKKACWVPDEKEGYLLGEIKATKGDVVSVGLPGGEVCSTCRAQMHSCESSDSHYILKSRQIARKIAHKRSRWDSVFK